MITKESAAKLVEFSEAVQKYAKAGDKENQGPVDKENSRRAWVLLKTLKDVCGHLEQADFYSILAEMPGKTPKDRSRCGQISKRECFDLMLHMREFEVRLAEFKKTPARDVVKLPEDSALQSTSVLSPKKAAAKKPVAKAPAKKAPATKSLRKAA